MTLTVTLLAPTPGAQFQAKSGNVYTANSAGVVTGVALGDVSDLMNALCEPILSPESQPVLPWVHSQFYGIPPASTLEALLTVTATLYAYPVYVPNKASVGTFNISVTTGQTGGACHLGIYEDNGGYPGVLIYDTGAVSGLTSTTVVTNTPTTPPVLTPGWYWLASIFTASGTYPSVAAIKTLYTGSVGANLGWDTAAHALATSAEAGTGISVAGTYGALPAVFTSGATITLNADTPAIALGV
jgi:hypothetical protein